MANKIEFSSLVGLTFSKIEDMEKDSSGVTFTTTDGRRFIMEHDQDCCERVYLEDVNGDVEDLIDSPILKAEENSSEPGLEPPAPEGADDATEWTFYRITTAKGLVVLRWFGSSNGYYSTGVDVYEQV